ncbi:MAG: dipeptide ABC transporter ATP-binding protein [Candidatus Puniceispirillaceae bacterium]
MSVPRLAIDNLSVRIGAAAVVDRASLSIGAGTVFGLAGESGSGKSMTALAVMGLLPSGAVRSGAARLDGDALFTRDEAEMCGIRGRRIGMIFQEPMTALNPVRSIGDQVAETLTIHSGMAQAAARKVAADRLDRVGLAAGRIGLDRYPHELSGGQRQRVMIAQAIALQPALLIADEPTTALDVTTQAGILDLLGGLVDEGEMSMLLITHDLAVLAGLSSAIAVMKDGRIVETGETEALFRNHSHAYTASLLAASSHRPEAVPAPDAPQALLRVEDLRLGYRGRGGLLRAAPLTEAVRGVSLSVDEGESVGLVGESGCGKSTLARAILGLEPPRAGSITLAGTAVTAGEMMPAQTRAAMQIVFQDPYGSFNPRHRVDRLVAEPFHLLADAPAGAEAARAVGAALEAVGLSPRDAGKYIHEFSGGQRQRIAIARALVIRPKLIILDEAVSALDVSIRAQILDLLAGLRGEFGLAYLFISHDLGVVRAITDRVLVMKDGEIVESGATEQVLASPSHPYTAELVAASPQIPQEWVA